MIQRASLKSAPVMLNMGDKAVWITGWNEAVDALEAKQAKPDDKNSVEYLKAYYKSQDHSYDLLRREVKKLRAANTAQQAAVPPGFALVPIKMTTAMLNATEQDDWQWADVLASAEAITEDQYAVSTQGCDAQQVAANHGCQYPMCHSDGYQQAVTAKITAELWTGVVVPPGYALVPIEPTPEMIAAGRDDPCVADDYTEQSVVDDYRAVYQAMLAAAPQPPQGDEK